MAAAPRLSLLPRNQVLLIPVTYQSPTPARAQGQSAFLDVPSVCYFRSNQILSLPTYICIADSM